MFLFIQGSYRSHRFGLQWTINTLLFPLSGIVHNIGILLPNFVGYRQYRLSNIRFYPRPLDIAS